MAKDPIEKAAAEGEAYANEAEEVHLRRTVSVRLSSGAVSSYTVPYLAANPYNVGLKTYFAWKDAAQREAERRLKGKNPDQWADGVTREYREKVWHEVES